MLRCVLHHSEQTSLRRFRPLTTHRAGNIAANSLGPRCLCTRSSGAKPESVAARKLRSPVTWASAAATLAALYGGYELQYRRQLHRERVAGRPDLGGPFELQDAEGNTVRDTDLLGQWVLLYFGFTKCPDICPQEMEKVTEVLARLDSKGHLVQPVFITIDPLRDDAARLTHFFKEAEYHQRFLPLTGSIEQVKRACRAYRVYFTKPTSEEIKAGDYLIDHSIISYLVAPDGQFAEYYGKTKSADDMEAGIASLIKEWEREKFWREKLPTGLANAVLGPPEPPRRPRHDLPKIHPKQQPPATTSTTPAS